MFSGRAADLANAAQRSGCARKQTFVFCHSKSSVNNSERLSHLEISLHKILLTWSRVGAVHGTLQNGRVNKNQQIAQLSRAVFPTPSHALNGLRFAVDVPARSKRLLATRPARHEEFFGRIQRARRGISSGHFLSFPHLQSKKAPCQELFNLSFCRILSTRFFQASRRTASTNQLSRQLVHGTRR